MYGMKLKDDPVASDRLARGLSTVALEDRKGSAFGLKSEEDIRKFEELNGFKILPDYDNLNINSLDNMINTHLDLPKLSYTEWNVQDMRSSDAYSQGPRSARNLLGNAAATNFNF